MATYVWGTIGEIKWFVAKWDENIKQEASVEEVNTENWMILSSSSDTIEADIPKRNPFIYIS